MAFALASSENINLELSQYNKTDVPVIASITTSTNTAFLEDTTGYSVSVPRFSVDISNIPIMRIGRNDEDYRITLEFVGNGTVPNYTAFGVWYPPSSEDLPIYSPSDFVEVVNRGLCGAYENLINQNFFASCVREYHTGMPGISTTWDQTHRSLPINVTDFSDGSKCAFVNLTLDQCVSTVPNIPLNIDLIAPDGTRCRIVSGLLFAAVNTIGKYVFSMRGNLDLSSLTLANGNTLRSNSSDADATRIVYIPQDTLLKFNKSAANGVWKLEINPSGFPVTGSRTWSFLSDASITIGCPVRSNDLPQSPPQWSMSQYPPLIDLDSDGYFTWALHEKFLQSNTRIKLGVQLQNILKIQKSNNQYLRIPVLTLSAGLDAVQRIRAEMANVYAINQLEKLQLYSDKLDVNTDFANDVDQSSAIMSFLLPNDGVEKFSEVSFAVDAVQWRRYKINTNGSKRPLTSFNISVRCQYKNGDTVNVYIYPRRSFNVLVNFHKD